MQAGLISPVQAVMMMYDDMDPARGSRVSSTDSKRESGVLIMHCEECNTPIEEIKDSIVEWISCGEEWAFSLCMLDWSSGLLLLWRSGKEIPFEEMNANDHWLPLADMEGLFWI